MSKAAVRMWGANARSTLSQIGVNHGVELSAATAERYAYEAADYYAEVKGGRRHGAEMLYSLADKMAGGIKVEGACVQGADLPAEEDDDEEAAVAAPKARPKMLSREVRLGTVKDWIVGGIWIVGLSLVAIMGR